MKRLLLFYPFVLCITIFFTGCESRKSHSIELLAGNNQHAEVESSLSDNIVILAKDQKGSSIEGVKIFIAVKEGYLSDTMETTRADGTIEIEWTLGPTVGIQELLISAYTDKGGEHLMNSPIIIRANADAITVNDYGGNKYRTATIGNQVWMAENLRVTHYADGTPIPAVSDLNGNGSSNDEWGTLNRDLSERAYCYPNDNANGEKEKYGALYNFAAAVNGNPQDSNENIQGVCPNGWHLPSNKEWDELINFISDDGYKDSVAVALKSNKGWRGDNGLDIYGFRALPAGLRASTRDGTFIYRNLLGIWWTSGYCEGDYYINGFLVTERMPCNRAIYFERGDVFSTGELGLAGENAGYSIRCIRD